MELKSKLLFFFFFGWKGIALFAQGESSAIIEQRIETISSLMEEGSEVDYSSLTEDLTYFARHPINLNATDALSLQLLLVLSDTQINALFKHIDYYGKLKSIFELQSVVGMDVPTIRWIQPFVYVNEDDGFSDFSFRRLREEGTHDIIFRSKSTLQEQAGFIPDPTTGKKNASTRAATAKPLVFLVVEVATIGSCGWALVASGFLVSAGFSVGDIGKFSFFRLKH